MESYGENEQNGREMQFTKVLASFVASMAFAIQGAVAADEALIAAAKKEGAVTWYTTQIVTQFARPAAEAFQKKIWRQGRFRARRFRRNRLARHQ